MGRLNLIERRVERFVREPLSVRNAAGVIVIATGVVVVGAGAAMTLIDSKEYPNIGVGLWWALQTVTTVGYGDVTPKHVSGRIVASIVMFEGIAFLAIITASITSSFVERAREARDLVTRKEEQTEHEQTIARFDELDRKLERLEAALRGSGEN